MSHSQKPQEALNPSVTEERYRALFHMPLYTSIHNLLDVLVQIANKMGLQKKSGIGHENVWNYAPAIQHYTTV
jgi:hypothetical protein